MGDFREKGELSADWHVLLVGDQGLGVGGWTAGAKGKTIFWVKEEKILNRRTRKVKADNMPYESSPRNAM